ncbi:MAG: L-2-amino-thiazoline-4-carboxylic acid hydrolase [Candidatus Hodarchaeota archaeon]
MGKEKAHETVEKVYERIATDGAKKKVEEKPINNFEEYKTTFKEIIKMPINSHATNVSIVEETSKKLSATITECLFAKTFKEMNATDLGYIMCCKPDFAMAKISNPKLELTRTKTLMRGDECCNPT